MLLPVKDHPELLDGVTPALARRRTGDALFTLKPGDDALLAELEAVVGRAFEIYARET
jgi:hypothetical protein